MAKPDILQLAPYPAWDQQPLEDAFTMHKLHKADDRTGFLAQVGPVVRGIAARGTHVVDRALIEACPNLEIIAVYGVGYDGVDQQACRDHSVRVTNTPDVLTGDVADLGVAMMLAHSRRMLDAERWARSGDWAGKGGFALTRRVHGRRAGILGLGRIGFAVARRLAGFDMDIAYSDITARKDAPGWQFVADPVALAARSDFLFVTLAATAATHHIVGSEVLAALGAEGMLINISRATNIDESALLDALESGAVGGAALDVFEGEPQINPRFLTLDNVLLQPHHASGTVETRKAMGQLMRDNLTAHFAGRALPDPDHLGATMKSIVIYAAKDLRIEDQPVETPGPGQIQVEISRGGICGSDLHYYNHGGFGTVRLKQPMVLGHEVAGRITELGDGVTDLRVGQQVAVSPSRPCGGCDYCLRGQPNHCLNMRFYGSAMPFPHIQGAFRQVLVADAAQCADADGLTPAEAAMAEPLAVCLHGARNAGPLLGKSVLVTGCGPIGVLSIIAARRAGADMIVATDLSDFTLGLAKSAGADRVINIGKDAGTLDEYAAGKGAFDAMFECSGAEVALRSAIPCIRPRGVVVQLGLGGDMTLPMMAVTAKELQLRGSFRFHKEFFTGVSLMKKGLIDVKPLITHTLPMADAVQAFELASDRSRAMKAQLDFTA